jgi:hypothetical protein
MNKNIYKNIEYIKFKDIILILLMAFKFNIFKGSYNYVENIKDKQLIITELFNNLDLSQFRYNLMTDSNYIQTLNFLSKNNHFVSLLYKGSNYLLCFFKIEGKHCCYCIDRKTLRYHKKEINYKKLLIVKIIIKAQPKIFEGSVFNCRLIQDGDKANFKIYDCFKYQNSFAIPNLELDKKLKFLNNNISINFETNKLIKISTIDLYHYTDLKKLVTNLIPESDFGVIGISFLPLKSGMEIIYIDNNDISQSKNQTKNQTKTSFYEQVNIKDLKKFSLSNLLEKRTYEYEKSGKEKNLLLKKTDITDVYNIYEYYEKDKKIGIAYIPSLKISHMCKEQICNDNYYEYNCRFNEKRNKWIPIKLIKKIN